MDRCSEHKDRQLRDYFLNRLTPEEVEVFQFHLFHCETCRMNLERMRLLVHEGEEEVVSASDAEVSNAKKTSFDFFSLYSCGCGGRVADCFGRRMLLFFVCTAIGWRVAVGDE